MKASTAIVIGVGAVAVVYLWSRSKSGSSLLGAPKAPSNTTTNLITAGTGLLGGFLGGWASSSAGSGSSTNTGFNSAPTETPASIAQGNYLADTTAASDDQTGVVGFGGWD